MCNAQIDVLSKLGDSGLHPNHCHGQLVSKLGEVHIKAAMSTIDIYAKKNTTMVKCTTGIMLQHQLLACIYENIKMFGFSAFVVALKATSPKFGAA